MLNALRPASSVIHPHTQRDLATNRRRTSPESPCVARAPGARRMPAKKAAASRWRLRPRLRDRARRAAASSVIRPHAQRGFCGPAREATYVLRLRPAGAARYRVPNPTEPLVPAGRAADQPAERGRRIPAAFARRTRPRTARLPGSAAGESGALCAASAPARQRRGRFALAVPACAVRFGATSVRAPGPAQANFPHRVHCHKPNVESAGSDRGRGRTGEFRNSNLTNGADLPASGKPKRSRRMKVLGN